MFKKEILVYESIIGIPTDAFMTPSLCTHVDLMGREIEPRLTT
jgi:hypothetical protein